MFNVNIGNGAFGSVYRAEFKQKVCAAKMLSQHARDLIIGAVQGVIQDAARKSILQECSVLEKLCHENIVQHFHTIIEPKTDLPILAMELMDCNLRTYISEFNPLSTDRQLAICHGVSCGLLYLHSHNYIHRDLCDDNILIKKSHKLMVKVSDFGLSTIMNFEAMTKTMTAIGHREGYLPPEGAGMKDSSEESSEEDNPDLKARYSHHLDIYSFGAIATQTVQSADQFKTRKQLKSNFKKIPDEHPLKEIIERCISKDSKQRPRADEVSVIIALKSNEIIPINSVKLSTYNHPWLLLRCIAVVKV